MSNSDFLDHGRQSALKIIYFLLLKQLASILVAPCVSVPEKWDDILTFPHCIKM